VSATSRHPLTVAVALAAALAGTVPPGRPRYGMIGGTVVAVLVWRNLTTDAATVAKGAYLSVAPAAGRPRHTLTLAVDPGNTGRLAVSPWTAR
jgi:hypothetical protein